MIDAANKILYREESFAIIGACMKVHRTLGAGFLEAVYEEALEREFQNLKIPFKRQVKLDLYYGNQKLTKQYRADFICYDEIIVEIKAVSLIPTAFYAQLQNYLKCTNIELGMLINFGTSSLTYKRMINLK
ncbi:MAG: GxxExxY protein [Flavobacterium sp.]|uniref:GxxExxY protein n=1 Tax=Flavobacterium sp. TaxID=239 RepID=UPI001B74977C|nr:GxxExxY protein [Flavobacterium sp.]MBP6146726.1 GxxExxY protein [Flavobacterium sp.]HRM47234.1 GxxExxY protein [Flavobacterium sp.]